VEKLRTGNGRVVGWGGRSGRRKVRVMNKGMHRHSHPWIRMTYTMQTVDTKVTPIWNTMGVIPGYIKDEVVLLGNHRDGASLALALFLSASTTNIILLLKAWVTGAADPTSGTVSTHEVIKAFGELLKSGWKPLRTIVLASWDAEEV
jgi:N-acetylated-alpha-linked acidic dipeptidase